MASQTLKKKTKVTSEITNTSFEEKPMPNHKTNKGASAGLGRAFRAEEAYEEMEKPHFKKFYQGKPTKRYLKLLNKVNKH